MRLLLVEDHEALAETLASALRRGGFAVDRASRLDEARELAGLAGHDLALLDLGLPDGDGMTLLAEWRAAAAMPVIVLTARDALADRLAGLDSGADDYLVKPVAPEELIARCRAVLRRPGQRLGTVLEAGGLRLDARQRVASLNGAPLTLGRRELGVLEQLLRRQGQVVARGALEEALYSIDDAVTPNALEAAVSRLRRALGPEAGVTVHTLRGVGWMLRVAG